MQVIDLKHHIYEGNITIPDEKAELLNSIRHSYKHNRHYCRELVTSILMVIGKTINDVALEDVLYTASTTFPLSSEAEVLAGLMIHLNCLL